MFIKLYPHLKKFLKFKNHHVVGIISGISIMCDPIVVKMFGVILSTTLVMLDVQSIAQIFALRRENERRGKLIYRQLEGKEF